MGERKKTTKAQRKKLCAFVVFLSPSLIKLLEFNYTSGENVYRAPGQTDSGRYLAVFFIYKSAHSALIISARDMSYSERKAYGRK